MGDKKLAIPENYKKQTRNLVQFRGMSDEEFEDQWVKKALEIEPSALFEKRIKSKLDEFEQDYDISDLKINDKETLRALVQAVISLEDYEQIMFTARSNGLGLDNIMVMDKINKIMSDLRGDISKLQDDLKITRKIRKNDQETSLVDYIESLKVKARKFYESKMAYIFCPKCNVVLGTIWTLYPEQKKNKIKLVCKRDLGDGNICDGEAIIGTDELLENRGTNNKEIMPESMR